jgi:6-phosphogluconolactonase
MPAEGGASPRWRVCANAAELAGFAAELVMATASEAIADHGEFRIALAGGSSPRLLYRQLRYLETDWSVWRAYFGDERCLPAGHADRNDTMARTEWLDHVTGPLVHDMPAERGPEDAASAYAAVLEQYGLPDLALLGMGEDGHTASLFPDHELGGSGDAPLVLPVRNAPKPPPERVSLSLHTLNSSQSMLLLIAGTGKRRAVADWRAGKDLPVARLAPQKAFTVLATADAMPAD